MNKKTVTQIFLFLYSLATCINVIEKIIVDIVNNKGYRYKCVYFVNLEELFDSDMTLLVYAANS